MPQPTAGDVHVNALLTNVSVAYIQSTEVFIADKVFPNIPVAKQSDLYASYPKEYWFAADAKERAPGTPSAGGGYTVDTTNNYFARIFAYHKDIDDPTRNNADSVFRSDAEATEFVTQHLLRTKEIAWATRYFGNVWGLTVAGVAGAPTAGQFKKWDVAGSTPIQDVLAQQTAIAEKTGYKPNTLVMDPYTRNVIKNHADVLDRIKYTQRGQITDDLLASLFEVDSLYVPWGVKRTSAEGQTGAFAFVYGQGALLVYSAPNPGLMTPSGGYTFSWTGYLGASAQGVRMKKFRMEELESDRVEGEMAYDQKIVGADLGCWFSAPRT